MPRIAIDFSKCVIYKIVCNDLNVTDLYVGSTTDFGKRKSQHKKRCNDNNDKCYNIKLYKMIREKGGFDDWTMLEIEKYPCNDSNEARTRERYWLEQLNAQLNTRKPITTNEETKELHKAWNKLYNEKNKEKIKARDKIYYDNNKDKIYEYQQEYRDNNKDKICEYQKEYRDSNKAYQIEYHKGYNKQQVTCTCGAIIAMGSKPKHNLSKSHLQALEKLLLEPQQI